MKITKSELQEIVNKSKSQADVCIKIYGYINGRNNKIIRDLMDNFKINISHFDHGASKHRKYEVIKKICPVCSKEFETKKGHKREKTVCSNSCANSYFRTGESHPNWNKDSYRNKCFKYHKKECVICKENVIVEVHHFDRHKSNNEPENLIPLCPTHHKYCHSRHYKLIKEKIENYIKRFKEIGGKH